MDGESRTCDLRDASFAYLTAAQQNYVFKLTESAQASHPDVISSVVPTNLNLQLERPMKAEEGEISVFGAEQYFNVKLDDGSGGFVDNNARNSVHPTDQKSGDVVRMRSKGRFGTPSVSSVSSWNSQTALLPSIRRNLSHTSETKKANERRFFPGFSCNGSCSDDKSINVDENVAARRGHQVSRRPPKLEAKKPVQSRFQPKDEFGKMNIGTKREEYLVLPTVNSGVHSLAIKREKKKSLEVEDPRISLEVFGTHVIKKEDIASNLERKLSVLTWDAIPFSKAQSLPRTNSATYEEEEEDPELESDASSDLFEIENISVSTQPIYTKNISGCMTPTSETSVEWSVATASAADFSFVSNCEEKKNTSSTPRNRRPNGLLGCSSQKSVSVAETVVYKRNEKPTLQQHPLRKL